MSSHRERLDVTPTGNGDENLLWSDFLRAVGRDAEAPPRPSPAERPGVEHAESFRKRRLTAVQQGREYPYDTSATANASGVGSSSATPIDLTSPPRRPSTVSRITEGLRAAGHLPSGSAPAVPRRESNTSEVVPPPWQPDADVTKCPVCQQEFSWRFRKHHCRKCGRVVCGDCSPHLITIPLEYIVKAPGEIGRVQSAQAVRVCKPCVPDPWMPHINSSGTGLYRIPGDGTRSTTAVPRPPTSPVPRAPRVENWFAENHYIVGYDEPRRDAGGSRAPPGPVQPTSEQLVTTVNANPPQTPPRRPSGFPTPLPSLRANDGGRMRAFSTNGTAYAHWATPGQNGPQPPSYGSGLTSTDVQQTGLARAQDSSSTVSSLHTTAGSIHTRPLAPPGYSPRAPRRPLGASSLPTVMRSPPAPAVARPRREVAEEDECPVCGNELPPGEDVRQQHISACITARMAAPSADTLPATPPRANNSRSTLSTNPSYLFNDLLNDSPGRDALDDHYPPGGARARPNRRSRGMITYISTEKDCLDGDGKEQECSICMEEFVPGVEMGRLECWCKYHGECIKQWWKVKGAGSCPVHVFHE